MSPLWPYPVASSLSLDGGSKVVVDLMDLSRDRTDGGPETIQSRAVWGVTGLANTQHTLVVSVGQSPKAGPNDPQYAIVDGFIYAVDDSVSNNTIGTSSFVSSTPPATSTLSSTPLPTSTLSSTPLPTSTLSTASLPTSTLSSTPQATSTLSTSALPVSTGSSVNQRPAGTPILVVALVCALAGLAVVTGIIIFLLWRRNRKAKGQGPPGVLSTASSAGSNIPPSNHSPGSYTRPGIQPRASAPFYPNSMSSVPSASNASSYGTGPMSSIPPRPISVPFYAGSVSGPTTADPFGAARDSYIYDQKGLTLSPTFEAQMMQSGGGFDPTQAADPSSRWVPIGDTNPVHAPPAYSS